ncbi:alcohol dehydrogenase [candidate division KSB3 bacterium]|uniref:alcohol dehydrogenase n=1 Tax=candidate division KSB3 bacterium TaxID=2044937 RepID=A0A2G6KK24_9BACT|nr:MAG: alcohol dehydrogenase [candidate division KSB3 bacterium]
MKAMTLHHMCSLKDTQEPLRYEEVDTPIPQAHAILVKVSVCGVCHTELDEIEGRTPPPHFPMIPGHQVVGQVASCGDEATRFQVGDRVGIAWIHSACGTCHYCLSDQENLCPDFRATGRDANGGYAEYMTVPEAFAYPIPHVFSDAEAAPLLCAGAIGYRSLRLSGLQNGQALGLTGFGASAHLVLKMVSHNYPDSEVFVFARSEKERMFARELGAVWSGDTAERTPQLLHTIIDTTPAWKPVVEALKNLVPGGRLIINAIRKEDADKNLLLRLDYPAHLWLEKEIKSVANVARRDVREFLDLAAEIPIKPEYETFALEDANTALIELKHRKIRGAKVLQME